MGLKKFQIVFDNPWSTYYSGQPVTGRLLLTVDSPKKIRGMLVVLSFVSVYQVNKTMLICSTLLGWSNDIDKAGGPFSTHGIGKGVHRFSLDSPQERRSRKSEYNIKFYRQEVERECGLHLSGSGPVDGCCDLAFGS